MLKIVKVLFSYVIIQITAGQVVRGTYPTVAAYPSEIAAGRQGAAVNGLSPVSAIPLEPVLESVCVTGTPLTFGLNVAQLAASNGVGLRVNSGSPIPITGVSVESDNIILEGPLAVSGELPFLGVVALEGPLSAAGNGAVAYGCGNGNVAIVSEGVKPVPDIYPVHPVGYPSGFAPGCPNRLGLAGYPASP